MQDADSSTSAEISGADGGMKVAAALLGGVDRSLEMLLAATRIVTSVNLDSQAQGIEAELDKALLALLSQVKPPATQDICSNPDRLIAPFCDQKMLAYEKSGQNFDNSVEAAAVAMQAELDGWHAALRAYQFAMSQADVMLQEAQTAAIGTYNETRNRDSQSREQELYSAMKSAIVAALQNHSASAASAAGALAAAAGTLIAAAQTDADAITAIQCQRRIDEAIADQSFWQNVENLLDDVN